MQKRKLFLSFAFLSTLLLSSCSFFTRSEESKESSDVSESSNSGGDICITSAPGPIPTNPGSSETSNNPSTTSSQESRPTSQPTSQSSSQPTSQPPVGESGFSNITEFNAPVEIHTAEQKTYLSYTGEYDKMPENQYPDGSQHISDSLPVNFSWNYTAPSGKTVSNYTFISGQKADLSDGYSITTSSKSL